VYYKAGKEFAVAKIRLGIKRGEINRYERPGGSTCSKEILLTRIGVAINGED